MCDIVHRNPRYIFEKCDYSKFGLLIHKKVNY